MVTELDKYKARTLQIFGFAFMAPFGQVVMGVIADDLINFSYRFVITFFLSITLVLFGIIIISQGQKHLGEK